MLVPSPVDDGRVHDIDGDEYDKLLEDDDAKSV